METNEGFHIKDTGIPVNIEDIPGADFDHPQDPLERVFEMLTTDTDYTRLGIALSKIIAWAFGDFTGKHPRGEAVRGRGIMIRSYAIIWALHPEWFADTSLDKLALSLNLNRGSFYDAVKEFKTRFNYAIPHLQERDGTEDETGEAVNG